MNLGMMIGKIIGVSWCFSKPVVSTTAEVQAPFLQRLCWGTRCTMCLSLQDPWNEWGIVQSNFKPMFFQTLSLLVTCVGIIVQA